MKVKLFFFMAVLFVTLLIPSHNAHAMDGDYNGDYHSKSIEGIHEVKGRKDDLFMPRVKPSQSFDCKQWESNGWIPELDYYLDADTSLNVAYNDYLEDLQWYYGQYPYTCHIMPEENPNK